MFHSPAKHWTFGAAFLVLLAQAACQRTGDSRRKIRLADETTTVNQDQLTTTIHLDARQRRSVAVMFFQNLTGDENLEWLQKGLAEMFIRTLSQSPSLSVLSMERLFEIVNRHDHSGDGFDLDIAAVVAREAGVEAVLTGNIVQHGDSLHIQVKLHEPEKMLVLKEENAGGYGLENLFGMVDRLSQQLKGDLQVTLGGEEANRGVAELTTNSLEAMRYYTHGMELASQYLFVEAAQNYAKAIALDSTFIDAYLGACQMYYSTSLAAPFEKTVKRLKELKSEAMERQGYQIDIWEACQRRDVRGMIVAGRKWTESAPKDKSAHVILGGLMYAMNKTREAIEHYQKVLEIDPRDRDGYNMLGYIYAESGDLKKSVATFRQYREIAPDEPNPYDSMGEAYMIHGRYGPAKRCFMKALQVNDHFNAALQHLGFVYLDEGRLKDAQKAFETLSGQASIQAEKLNALYLLGLTYWRMGLYLKSLETFQEAIAISSVPNLLIKRTLALSIEQQDSLTARQTLENAYSKVRGAAELTPSHLQTLADYSLWYGVRPQETLRILSQEVDKVQQPLLKANIEFLMLLVSLRHGIDMGRAGAREEAGRRLFEQMARVVESFREYPSMTFNQQGRYFAAFHRYLGNPGSMIHVYRPLIDRFAQENLISFSMFFRGLLADIYERTGEDKQASEERALGGMPDEGNWMLIGPFPYQNGYLKRYPPERRIALKDSYAGKEGRIRWEPKEDGVQDGFIDLNDLFQSSDWSVAYACIDIESDSARNVQFRTGADEMERIWLNGKEVWHFFHQAKNRAEFDGHLIDVALKPGLNRVLVKVGNWVDDWGFYFRVTDEDGKGIEGIRFRRPGEGVASFPERPVGQETY